ncbi:hypothetical protein [Rhodopila sp.]|jgi:hypothetical protein|uniref:hypothetical protein n=1 Tax=Rhodopila sp. TaxID=2480087 RepID=UPI002B7E732F|nr:hypothetical protein [Rhodopila sp.]HVZ10743.1 hypothetical protein [Rhodopila sp.]
MSSLSHLPTIVVDITIAFLLPLILPAAGGDRVAAEAGVRALLAGYQPADVHELNLAAQVVGHYLKSLGLLGESAAQMASPRQAETAIRLACSTAKIAEKAETMLERRQALRRAEQRADGSATGPAETVAGMSASQEAAADGMVLPKAERLGPAAAGPSMPATGEVAGATETETEAATAAPDAAATAPGDGPAAEADPVAEAEAKFRSATRLLHLMKAHHKGAPPPHSQAAQQIKAQERVVNMARLSLEQARRGQAAAETAMMGAG